MNPLAPIPSRSLGPHSGAAVQSTTVADRPDGGSGATVSRSATLTSSSASVEATRLRKAAQDFESVFLRQMLSGLEKTTQVSAGGRGNAAQSTYGSMVVDTVAEAVAKAGGLGLGDVLARSLSSRMGGSAAAQNAASNPTPAASIPPGRPTSPASQSPKESKILPQGLSPLAVPRAEIRTSDVPITGLLADRRIR